MTTDERPIHCPHCGTRNKHGAYGCNRCGERLYRPNRDEPPPLGLAACGKCSAANEAHAFYCVDCGNSMASAVRISPEGTSPTGRVVAKPLTAERPREAEAPRAAPEPSDLRGTSSGGNAQGQQTANTSGARDAQLPDSLRGFNWGAFLITPIWSIFNGVWIGLIWWVGLLAFVLALPDALRLMIMFGQMALAFYLGFNGNELAWRGKRWASAEHFVEIQKYWRIGSIVLTVLALVFILFRLAGQTPPAT